jgi:hypothetical protein
MERAKVKDKRMGRVRMETPLTERLSLQFPDRYGA